MKYKKVKFSRIVYYETGNSERITDIGTVVDVYLDGGSTRYFVENLEGNFFHIAPINVLSLIKE